MKRSLFNQSIFMFVLALISIMTHANDNMEYAKERLKAHTTVVPASQDERGNTFTLRRILKQAKHEFNMHGLSEEDLTIIRKMAFTEELRKRQVQRHIVEIKRIMSSTDQPDSGEIAKAFVDLENSEETAKRVYYSSVVAQLSEHGQSTIRAATAETRKLLDYKRIDYVGLAADAPELVQAFARKAAANFDVKEKEREPTVLTGKPQIGEF